MKFYETKILTRVIKSPTAEEIKLKKEAEKLAELTGEEFIDTDDTDIKEVWTEFSLKLDLVTGYYKTFYPVENGKEDEATHVYWDSMDIIIQDKYHEFKDIMEKFCS